MSTDASFRATILFGLAYIVIVAACAALNHADRALLTIIACAGVSYLSQGLATTASHFDDVLYGQMDDAEAVARIVRRYNLAAMVMWGVALVLALAAFLLLIAGR